MDFSTTTQPIYQEYKKLAERLVRQLYVSPRHTRIALVTFSSVGGTYTVFDLKRYDNADDVIRQINDAQYSGGTTAVGKSQWDSAQAPLPIYNFRSGHQRRHAAS